MLHDQSSFTLTQKLAFCDEVEKFSTLTVPRGRIERSKQILLTKLRRCQWAWFLDKVYLLKYKEAALTPFPDLMQLDDVGVVLNNRKRRVRISLGQKWSTYQLA